MSLLHDLEATILSRKGADPDTSWTAKLLAKGRKNAPRNSVRRPLRPSSKR